MIDNRYSVPIAWPVAESEVPDAALGADADLPVPAEGPVPAGESVTANRPRVQPCAVSLPDGCYRLAYTPAGGGGTYRGTLRVDRGEGQLLISGDLYFMPSSVDEPEVPVGPAAPPLRPFGIPIYPRARYQSYLKGTQAQLVSFRLPGHPCTGTLVFEQYNYTQPAPGSFNGSFPAAPGSRTVTIRFAQRPRPHPFWPGNYYEGQWLESGVVTGTVVLGWVSSSFRRCTVEIDTLVDSVAPKEVPALGGGTESFATMLASAGWKANVVYDQVAIPVPAEVPDPKACWQDGKLHSLMNTVRASTDLDAEWRMHVLVVPGNLTCSRGKMYDMIQVPREGVVSYSNDGYPDSDSAFFGTAENQMQRDVPRAYLRSASHEVVHGFNQIHQEQEGGADNSIMTTTPSVADVLGTASTGDPGVFPDDIKLRVNRRVRHHLAHFPDPVVRPGGHTFASWRMTPVPSADLDLAPDVLEVAVEAGRTRVELGEPVQLTWTVTNRSDRPIAVPEPVTTESTYALITVVDAAGRRRVMPPFVIECDASTITELEPSGSRSAMTRLYWSTNGFAFDRPGTYTVEVRLEWTVNGSSVAARGTVPIFVNYPAGDDDNAAAADLLHPDVGKWVALGGSAPHLTDAISRLNRVASVYGVAPSDVDRGENGTAKALRGYAGIMPS